MLTKAKKDKVIAKYATHKNDTGSPEVQVAVLTAEIEKLTDHLKKNRKDQSSRRGLLGMVVQRRKQLNYLEDLSEERYSSLKKKLKLR